MKPITIIGGGLAGLTLGILLRRNAIPVTVIEAGHYPRHRVCGELISGAGVSILTELEMLQNACLPGTRAAHDAAFFATERTIGSYHLPRPALCVSRFNLDAALSSRFQELGGELHVGERWRDGTLSQGMVYATGRRAQATEEGWRWFGLKVHAHGVALTADLEMHVGRDAYVGLCQLPDGMVNVCGLFRRRTGSARGESLEWLRGAPGSQLFRRLARAEFDANSFCAVGGLSLRPQRIDEHECRIGDALTMIPPITGNGMSMAFESAQMATNPLLSYARGERTWAEATAELTEALRRRFSKRLWCAEWLHRWMFSAGGAKWMRALFCRAPIWRAAFALTR